MPQNPNQVYPALYSGVAKPLAVDASGALIVADNQGDESALLNITSTGAVAKLGAGVVGKISVTTAGAAGAVYDYATVAGVGAANLIGVIPATVGVYSFDWPVSTGIVVIPGAAQVVSATFR